MQGQRMSPNPDQIYQAKAAMEPVAPVTLWLYPQLKLVEGSMQRSILGNAKRKASIRWLYRLLMFGWLTALMLKAWARETGRTELWRSADNALLVVLVALLALLVLQFLRTRKLLRREVSFMGRDDVDG
jgi:hypothetical protein